MSTRTDEEKLTGCFYSFVSLALTPVLTIWDGFVASVLWAWFVSPTFHVAPLRLPQAIGLGLVVGIFRWSTPSKADWDEPSLSSVPRRIACGVLTPAILLGVGAIVRLFL